MAQRVLPVRLWDSGLIPHPLIQAEAGSRASALGSLEPADFGPAQVVDHSYRSQAVQWPFANRLPRGRSWHRVLETSRGEQPHPVAVYSSSNLARKNFILPLLGMAISGHCPPASGVIVAASS